MNSFHINFIDKKYSNLLASHIITQSLFLFFMILTSVVIPVASSTTAIGASIRIATIIAVILRLHHVLRIVVHLGRPMASMAPGMAPVVGLLRLRIVVVVRVRRAHVVALHIVALTTSLALTSRVFFAPRALDGGASNISAVDGHDGGASGLLVVVPDKGVAFVAEVPDFEDASVG